MAKVLIWRCVVQCLQICNKLSLLFVLILAASVSSVAQKKTTLYNFTDGNDGGWPFAGVTLTSSGALYGTASNGGDEGCAAAGPYCGTVFELTPPAQKGGLWTDSTIYTFGQNEDDSSTPESGVVFDSKGNLYGTTAFVNAMYQLAPQSGGVWASNWLYAASSTIFPPLIDKENNLYVSDPSGGQYGTILELSPNPDGTFTTATLYSFAGGADGQVPGGITMDSAGRIWGLTSEGGNTSCEPFGCGTIFVLLPPSQSGGAWTHHVLYDFLGGAQGIGGLFPMARDSKGNLYGITTGAGSPTCSSNVCAIVFELSPPVKQGEPWTYNIVHTFTGGNDGSYPQGSLVLDSHGALYGTTVWGGGGPCIENGSVTGCGTIYRLNPPSHVGGAWTETFLHRFQGGSDGKLPYGTVWLDEKNLVLYGTTSFGGSYDSGTVFEITP
jgi:hypothetical protein